MIAGERLPDVYCVRSGDRPVGRIRLAHERTGQGEGWDWSNVPLPIPSWGVGRAESLEEAKAAFRKAWGRFHASLTLQEIQHWHHHQDAAGQR
jgi:hypothetical protein